MAGEQGRDQARRRFGAKAGDLEPETPLSERRFELEDLFEDGGRGLARAAVLHGNQSAKQALNDLARLERDVTEGLPDDYRPPAAGEHPWLPGGAA